MDRKITKTIAGLGLSLAVVSTQLQFPMQVKAEELEKPKNIVFILADDLGWKDLGCFGSEYYKTPNLDKLAENGMKFTNAYSAAPLCSATRASVLTGWAPARQHLHAVTPHTRANYGGFADFEDWTSPPQHNYNKINKTSIPKQLGQFPLGRITIATILKEKGYKTGFFGKWHMGPDADKYPDKHGFDINIGGNNFGWPPSYFDPYGLDTIKDRKKGEYLTDRLTDEALTFIKESNSQQKPFLAYVSHYAVHDPFQAKQEDIDVFNGVVDPQGLQDNKVYAGMVKSLDDSVGKLVKTVDELGIANDTMFIFVSDNGGIAYKKNTHVTSMYPLRGCKSYMYEGGIRVPMIAYMPGIVQKGVVSEEPVITTDIFPTLLDFTGVSPKENYPMDGKSLMPLFTGNGEFERDYLTWFFPHNMGFGTRDHLWPNATIRQGDYKLIKEFEYGYKLYNLREDIGENNNLADTMPELVKELDDKLMTELNKQNAHIPVINPNYNESESLKYINDPKNKAEVYTVYKKVFKDLVGHWARKDIDELVDREIVKGISEDSFEPEKNITRAEFLALIIRALNIPIVKGNSYNDIDPNGWYADTVATGKANGIIDENMVTSGFNADKPITREEMTSYVVNALKKSIGINIDNSEVRFEDKDKISNWAKKYVASADKVGIIKGITETKFAPSESATRAQAAVITRRLLNKIDAEKNKIIQTFEDDKTEGFNFLKAKGTIKENPNGSGKSLELTGNADATGYQPARKIFTLKYDTYEVSMKVFVKNSVIEGSNASVIQLRDKAFSKVVAQVAFNKDKIIVNNKADIPYQQNSWIDFNFRIDMENKKVNLIFDGEEILKDQPFINEDISDFSGINFAIIKDTVIYVDDIFIAGAN